VVAKTKTKENKMPLIQDNSYLLDFDKDDTLGYIFNYNIYANKNDISIWKDSDNEKLFFNVANAYSSKLCHAIRGYEVQYSVPVYALFTELKTISVVKSDNINDEQHLFWWVNKTYDDASRLSEKLKKKDTPPQNTIEVA